MSEIVRSCIKHGDLTIEQIYRQKRSDGKFSYMCRQCKRDRKNKSRRKHREAENKKQVEKAKIRYWLDPEKNRKEARERHQKYINNLDDSYIKKKLCQRSLLTVDNLTPEMIDIKRVLLKIDRLKRANND